MYQIVFYAPSQEVERVKSSMFQAGAGKIGNYEFCSFESSGIGQFRPLAGANPFLGTLGELEKVSEVKVEMVCEKSIIKEVILALKSSHPYEMPAYHVIELLNY